MKIYNKQPKPKLRVYIEFTEAAELVLFAIALDHIAVPTPGNQIPEQYRNMAKGMLERLVVAWPALKKVEQLMWTDLGDD